MTHEQIKQATIGELKPHNAPIVLVEYDPTWPKQFDIEAQHIRTALSGRALKIEHIGSTSVPGLIAKPIIDILLVVTNSADEPSYVPVLEAAGYVLRIREPDWHEHRLFKGPRVNINLHVFSNGSAEIIRVLAFRDWLRTDSQDRELYAQTKRKLASQEWKYVQNYADAKTEIIEKMIARSHESSRQR